MRASSTATCWSCIAAAKRTTAKSSWRGSKRKCRSSVTSVRAISCGSCRRTMPSSPLWSTSDASRSSSKASASVWYEKAGHYEQRHRCLVATPAALARRASALDRRAQHRERLRRARCGIAGRRLATRHPHREHADERRHWRAAPAAARARATAKRKTLDRVDQSALHSLRTCLAEQRSRLIPCTVGAYARGA